MNAHTQKIIALLFYSGETFSLSQLSKIFGTDKEEIEASIQGIDEHLRLIGLALNRFDDTFSLTNHPDTTECITQLRQEELQGTMSPAALETLALVLYRQPIKKSDIDYIRGVNSQFILRNLHSKGLVTREKDPAEERSHIYKPTLALLEFMGLQHIHDLPDYETIRKELSAKEELLHQEDNA